ncbi:MAG: sugar ABC transporter substrate-binding protein [Alphaproteobacteria bacterium]|nr:sugar ABC transporter substrate-binding protein [Alphaproteobacteria bacterium]
MKLSVSKILLTASAVALVGLLASPQANAQAGVDAAKKLIADSKVIPAFKDPGPAFNAKQCMAGKKMFVIPLASQNPFNVQVANAMKDAAKLIGFDLAIWENQMQLPQWVQGMQQAMAQNFNVIDLQGGIPPAALPAQIKEARAKGIKVTTTHLYDVTQKADDVDGSIKTNYSRAGQIMAAWAIAQTNGKVNAVIMGSDEIVPTVAFVKAIQDYLNANCPGCKHIYKNVPVAEWGTKIASELQAAMQADPAINFFLPIYDNMMQFGVQPVRVMGRQGQVQFASYNGSANMLDLQRTEMDNKGIKMMNVGESLGWVGMAGVDYNMRLLCNVQRSEEINTPLYVFDDTNIKNAGVPAEYNKGYGDAHTAAFRRLWQLN